MALCWAGATPLLCAARAQLLRGVAPAHTSREQRMFLESKMKCMGEPRVYPCNPEATSLGKSSPQEDY